jgi:hypothetical protein
MSIEILNGFVILSIKHDLLKNIEYKSLINNFVVKTVCKVIFQYIFFLKIKCLIFLHYPRSHNS